MKIIIDARELCSSTGRYVDRLLHYLQEIDERNSYVILLKSSDFDNWQPSNPNFHKVRCPYKEFTFGEQYGLVWQLYGLRADLVHFGMTQQPILYFGRTVTTIHDLTTARFRNPAKNRLTFTFKQVVYKWLIKRVARKSRVIIVPSEFVKNDVAQYAKVPADKITVTYEAADQIAEAAEPLPQLTGKTFLLYVGRAEPHKNLNSLVDAYALIKQSRPDLSLVLAGRINANHNQLQKFVNDKEINDVIFTDFVSEGQLKWLYQNTAAYVFPSLSEGFGLPGLEAMVHGAPVVSSNATCLPEIYGQAAHYFDPNNIAEMAAKIAEVLDSRPLKSQLVKAGQDQAVQYSWRRMAEQTLAVYTKILPAKPSDQILD